MNTRLKRLPLLEQRSSPSLSLLIENQLKLLQSLRVHAEGKHIDATYPGALLHQDTFSFGYLKGVGTIYIQVVVDCFCSFCFAKLSTSKLPETACDILDRRLLPFYEKLNIPLHAILTNNGREFHGRPYKHPYELFCALENIERRRTKVRSPWTNGFVERLNRTILDEFLRVQGGRPTWATLEDIQGDLDDFRCHYNFRGLHQGYRLNGKTPAEALLTGKRAAVLAQEAYLVSTWRPLSGELLICTILDISYFILYFFI